MNLDRELLFRFFNKETTLEEEKKIRLWIDIVASFSVNVNFLMLFCFTGIRLTKRAAPDSIFHGIKWWLLFPVLQRL